MERYFAYGSNMSTARIRSRCPSAQLVGVGWLRHHRLTFFLEDESWDQGGVAGVVPCPGERVEGVLYDLAPEDLPALDAYEAVDDGDYHRDAVVIAGPHTSTAWIYLPGAEVETYVAPSARYVAALREGALEHGLEATLKWLDDPSRWEHPPQAFTV